MLVANMTRDIRHAQGFAAGLSKLQQAIADAGFSI